MLIQIFPNLIKSDSHANQNFSQYDRIRSAPCFSIVALRALAETRVQTRTTRVKNEQAWHRLMD